MSGFKVQGEDLNRRYFQEYELVDNYRNSFYMMSVGCGINGKLGDGTTVNKSSPVSVLNTTGQSWKKVSPSGSHAIALTSNGVAWGWGDAASGALGDNSTVDKSSPVSVIGGITWRTISTGNNRSYGISQEGIWYSWGSGGFGGLGDNTATSKSSPVTVSGGGVDWIDVQGGNACAWALKNDGSIWATGLNAQGGLGDNSTVNKSSPVSVIGGFTWKKLAVGNGITSHMIAIRDDGTLWAWGAGANGALGNGLTTNQSSPVSVLGGFTDWKQASIGGSMGAAIRQNGTLWTWGISNALGHNSTSPRSSPGTVSGEGTNWKQISAGGTCAAAIKTDGSLWTWGTNLNGQIGDGTTTSKSSPISVISYGSSWISVHTHASSSNTEITLAIGE